MEKTNHRGANAMKHRHIRWLAAILTMVLLGTAGCGRTPDTPDISTPIGDTTTTTTTAATTTTTAKQPAINPLTGIRDMTTDLNRPVGFVVTDESAKVTQLHLESADFYFEAETEGGIPRILAVYSSLDRIPDTIGPVRSARTHFVKMAKAMDMIYCHIGGSQGGKDTIKELGVADLGNEYEINDILKNSSNVSWNRSAFTAKKVLSAVKSKGYRTSTTVKSPYAFGEKTGSMPATTVDVQISESFDMAFTYDAASGLYQKHRNALSTPIHTTYTGGTVEARNVIVMYDHRFVDPNDAKRYDFDLESGSGILASGGTSREIRWVRNDSGLHYYESDGTTPLTVATGKTFVCLVSDTLKGRTRIE